MSRRYESFGRVFPAAGSALPAQWAIARLKAGDAAANSMIAYGNGRSYGDSCLHAGTGLFETRSLANILSFDTQTGIIEAEAGALLSDLIAHAAPSGHFPQVVPGTQFVTVGGAIANDVHGKNHHRRGTFGSHVESLTLLRSDGRTIECSPTANAGLFAATIGGLGLTGLILSARIRLMRVPSLDVVESVTPFGDLDEFFDLAAEADLANEYVVAWIDQLAPSGARGRGLLMTGNHAQADAPRSPGLRRWLCIPFQPPVNLVNRPVLRVFNRGFRLVRGLSRVPHLTPYQRFFFQLDGVSHWNRLYGPRGLFQHQSVIPEETARQAIPELLAVTKRSGQGSFLTVLKRFGRVPSPGLLSFPRPGYTLTLDFPNKGAATTALLARLDAMTIEAGGAVNPYKDARMSPETFAASFPNWTELERWRDPAFQSRFWQRTAGAMLRGAGKPSLLRAAE